MDCTRRNTGVDATRRYFDRRTENDPAAGSAHRVRKPHKKKPPAKVKKPEKILQAFNTWAFKREQPDSADAMLRAIAAAEQHDRPLQFVLYWGKGPRDSLDTPDTTCLDYLGALVERVRAVYPPGASVKLIFTDTHAALNGHSPQRMHQYFTAVATAAAAFGFGHCRLSDLVREAASAGIGRASLSAELPEPVREKLVACAAKWFRGEGTSEEGAMRYLQMNMVEKQAIEFAFPAAIFVTFNGSEFRNLFPDRLPVFYMYSLRRGVSVKPWFLSSEPAGSDSSQPARG